MNFDDSQLFGVVAIGAFLYGYATYGTPVLPRRTLRYFLQVSGTSMFAFSLLRNGRDPTAPWERFLPVMVWSIMVVGGAVMRAHIEVRFSWRDLFSEDVADVKADVK